MKAAESTEDDFIRPPGAVLSDELGVMIDVTFEELFNPEESSDGMEAEDANAEPVAFVVKPQVVPKDGSERKMLQQTRKLPLRRLEPTAVNVNWDLADLETEAATQGPTHRRLTALNLHNKKRMQATSLRRRAEMTMRLPLRRTNQTSTPRPRLRRLT